MRDENKRTMLVSIHSLRMLLMCILVPYERFALLCETGGPYSADGAREDYDTMTCSM